MVDSGDSSSAIRRSLTRKLDQCVGHSVRFRSQDNKTVAIDLFVNMAVTWEGRKTMVERVAPVKHMPFSVILGVDWIIAIRSDLILKEKKLVPVPQLTTDNEVIQNEAPAFQPGSRITQRKESHRSKGRKVFKSRPGAAVYKLFGQRARSS